MQYLQTLIRGVHIELEMKLYTKKNLPVLLDYHRLA